MSTYDKLNEEKFRWQADKVKHRQKMQVLKRQAHKEFYVQNRVWFKTLDYMGILLFLLNMVALLITGVLVVQASPDKVFVEANPVQCNWNGYSCHADGAKIMGALMKQLALWTVLVVAYLYTRSVTSDYISLWILTAIMVFYAITISWDTINDVGLYLGKILFGRVIV
jgi:hypothetical protein